MSCPDACHDTILAELAKLEPEAVRIDAERHELLERSNRLRAQVRRLMWLQRSSLPCGLLGCSCLMTAPTEVQA